MRHQDLAAAQEIPIALGIRSQRYVVAFFAHVEAEPVTVCSTFAPVRDLKLE
jgi:hypothetical protein